MLTTKTIQQNQSTTKNDQENNFNAQSSEINNPNIQTKQQTTTNIPKKSNDKPNSNNDNVIRNIALSNRSETIELSQQKKNLIFAMFLLSNLFLNYDTGVIPASLLEIMKEIDFDYKEQALLGSLVYLGLSFASLFVSLIFTKFGPSKVCSVVLLLNTCCCFTFSLSYSKPVLFVTRFLMGVTEAFVVIYGPVWVNNYSPVEHSAKWMGILHSCSALGVVLGYVVAGITINVFGKWLTWRFAIQIQGFAQVIFSLFFFIVNEQYINVDLTKGTNQESINNDKDKNDDDDQNKHQNKRSVIQKGNSSIYQSSILISENRIDSIETNNFGRYLFQAKTVITNPLYLTITFGLCSIYFIVTGIQFWMTEYLIVILKVDPITVVIGFSITSVTAPLLGVLMGGVFADNYGGYRGKNSVKAMKLCCAFGFVSFVFAFPMGFLFSPVYLMTLLWVFLFFGAAIIPVGTGIMISTVNRECQATSSSLSQLTFNLFGYFFSPILTGFIMDLFDNPIQGFIWGMRVVFWWVLFSLLFLILSFVLVYNKNKRNEMEEKDLMEEEMEENMAELMKIEIRRQLAQKSV